MQTGDIINVLLVDSNPENKAVLRSALERYDWADHEVNIEEAQDWLSYFKHLMYLQVNGYDGYDYIFLSLDLERELKIDLSGMIRTYKQMHSFKVTGDEFIVGYSSDNINNKELDEFLTSPIHEDEVHRILDVN